VIAVVGLLLTTVIGGDDGNGYKVRTGNDIGERHSEGRTSLHLAGTGHSGSYCSSALRRPSWIDWMRSDYEQDGTADACDKDGTVATQEGAGLDVQLHTQAHLQAQGGTPTPAAEATSGMVSTAGTLERWQPYADALGRDEGGVRQDGSGGTVSPTVDVRLPALICAYPWPQGCDYWIDTAWCESTLGQDPNAYADWNPYVGLFQIWVGHGYGREWLKDDANNTLAAWELSHEGTYTGAWPHCQW